MAVVHTSLGTLTAFQPDGHVAWQVQQLVGSNWRHAQAATLQAVPLRPGGLPGAVLVAGMRQAHLVSHQGHTMASFPMAVRPRGVLRIKPAGP